MSFDEAFHRCPHFLSAVFLLKKYKSLNKEHCPVGLQANPSFSQCPLPWRYFRRGSEQIDLKATFSQSYAFCRQALFCSDFSLRSYQLNHEGSAMTA
jgi:hypothetical protein